MILVLISLRSLYPALGEGALWTPHPLFTNSKLGRIRGQDSNSWQGESSANCIAKVSQIMDAIKSLCPCYLIRELSEKNLFGEWEEGGRHNGACCIKQTLPPVSLLPIPPHTHPAPSTQRRVHPAVTGSFQEQSSF